MAVVGFFPFPHTFNELLTAQIMSGLLLTAPKHLLDHGLRSNASMIRAGDPQSGKTTHSVPPDKDLSRLLASF
jgi:hypothetical protein